MLTGAGVAAIAGVAGFATFRLARPAPARPAAVSPPAAPGSTPAPTAAPGGTSAAPLAQLADIPESGGVVLTDLELVVTRGSGAEVRCFSAVCTHQGCLVASVQSGRISCPCHGSEFDATTGAVLAGPAPSPLPAVPVSVVDGAVVPR